MVENRIESFAELETAISNLSQLSDKITATLNETNATYELLGIQKQGDTYYYRMLDKTTGKLYFVEFNNNITIQTNYTNLLESNKSVDMLDTSNLDKKNIKKHTDENTLYFVNDYKESQGTNFANVIDPTDAKTYYVAIDDSSQEIAVSSIANVSKSV